MKKLTLPVTLFIVIFSISVSCKKSSDNSSTPPHLDAKTALITKSTWNKTNEGTDNDRDGVIDVVSAHFLQACNTDDMATFQTNGKLIWSEGAVKCNASDPDNINLTWKFTSDGINMLDKDLKIFKLTETEFSVYYEQTSGANTTWEMMQFKH